MNGEQTVPVYASMADAGLYRFKPGEGRQLVGTILVHPPRLIRGWTAAEVIEAAAIGERGIRVEWARTNPEPFEA